MGVFGVKKMELVPLYSGAVEDGLKWKVKA